MAQVICGETLSDILRWISLRPCALVNDAHSQREETLGKWKLFEESSGKNQARSSTMVRMLLNGHIVVWSSLIW